MKATRLSKKRKSSRVHAGSPRLARLHFRLHVEDQSQVPAGAIAYPGTEVIAGRFFARSWEAQDNTYEPGEYTAPSIAESSDVDPPAKTCVA